MSKEHHQNGVIGQVEYKKRFSEIKWTDRDYHVQDNTDVAHKNVKIYCDTNLFPEIPFCGPHPNPHGARRLSKYYNLRFDPKLGHGICANFRIPCAFVGCTSMLEKPWIPSILLKNRRATNLSPTVLIGQLWGHITIGISLS